MKSSSSNVERGAEILIKLADAGSEGMSLSELAEFLNDSKAGIHRALTGLAAYGFVQQSNRRGKYRLGATLHAIAMKSETANDVARLLRPALVQSSIETSGAIYLMARAGRDVVCLGYEEGQYIIPSLIGGVGGRQPLGMGAASICMLAELDERSRGAILKTNEARIKEYIPIAKVHEAIDFYHKNGFSLYPTDEQLHIVNIAVSVPKSIAQMDLALALILPDGRPIDVPAVAATLKRSLSQLVPEKAGKTQG